MKKLSSTQALSCGFAVVIALLAYSAAEALQLQRTGGERQRLVYRRFIRQDDAITSIRRTVWLGGIYSRDFFLNGSPAGRRRFSARLEELRTSGMQSLAVLRDTAPVRLSDLQIEADFDQFLLELRQLEAPPVEGIPPPGVFIEEVLVPRRLALLATFAGYRASARQELRDTQIRYDVERAAAARALLLFLGAALVAGVAIALASLHYATRLERDRQRHFEAISLANRELENLSARLLEIQEQERRALSRELHDEVGQTLTALRIEISQAIFLVPESGARERLRRARQLAERTVQMVRDISLMLRPSLLDDLGLGAALQWQLERFSSRSGIHYVFEGAGVGERLPDPVKTCVFRIAQEALNNCEKYAEAAALRVLLRHDSGRVSLEVQDDGFGFTLDQRGLPSRGTGILGMKERAHKLGGTLTVESSPGAGTRVALVLPAEQAVPIGPGALAERG